MESFLPVLTYEDPELGIAHGASFDPDLCFEVVAFVLEVIVELLGA